MAAMLAIRMKRNNYCKRFEKMEDFSKDGVRHQDPVARQGLRY